MLEVVCRAMCDMLRSLACSKPTPCLLEFWYSLLPGWGKRGREIRRFCRMHRPVYSILIQLWQQGVRLFAAVTC
jgi:hypothetical protein